MAGTSPKRANFINLSVVIVRVCGRSSNHGKSHLAPLCQNLPHGAYWMPRLKRGMTTREIGEESSRPMGAFPDLFHRLVV